MKKTISILFTVIIILSTSAFAFEKDRESSQVIKRIDGDLNIVNKRFVKDDNFKSTPDYFIKNKDSKASLYVKCSFKDRCSFVERFDQFDFERVSEQDKNRGNKDNMMFTLY